ncbi:MAG: hypothetical protein ACT4PZ_10060 [Panacagrimonas sp.]
MFKKHSIALVLGAMCAAPAAFADDLSTEGVIYQADQTGSIASINQVVNETPQAAAILQIDTGVVLGDETFNSAIVLQGLTAGNGGVTIDDNGNNPTNAAVELFVDFGVGVPTFPVAEDYTDGLTGGVPNQFLLLGTTSDNYSVIIQDGQRLSRAAVIQASDLTAETVIPLQDSLFNSDLPGNGDALQVTADGATIIGTLIDVNRDEAEVIVSYTGGEVAIDGIGDSFVLGEAFIAPLDEAEGNLAVVTQGAALTFANLNNEGFSVDALEDPLLGEETTNTALVIQGGINGFARIGQQGLLNNSAIVQLSDGDGTNVAESYQYTDENDLAGAGETSQNFSFTGQAGNFNLAQTFQAGTINSSTVLQYGDGNIATVDQNAINAVAFVYQSNAAGGGAELTGNVASIYQYAVQ